MAAYAALASLLNNIHHIVNHSRLSTSLDINQIQSLQEKAGLLLDFIESYDYAGVIAEDVERQIACAAHAAEEVIENHIVDQILDDDDGETSSSFLLTLQKKLRDMKKKIQDLKGRIPCTAHADEESHIHGGSNQASFSLQQIIQDMDALLKKANELKEKEGLREEQPTHSTAMVGLREDQPIHSMVGFEDELIQIMDELTNQQSSRHIISIVGMGGMGKTTLAHNLYQNLLIKQHFDIRAWITVSQQYNLEEILSQLLSSLGKSSSTTVDELGQELHKTLSGRRYLIILDDIWSVQVWDEVRHFFPDNGNRSRVLLTTRLLNLARACHSRSCFMKKPLDEDTSWELFCKKAFQQENCPYPQLEKVGKEIARLCSGLPLSTVVIGGLLLNSPRSLQFWENVVRNIKSNPNAKEKEESLDILSLSYNHLSPHLKPCFLYMGAFKEDSEIRVSKIIKLWIAEGFVRPKGAQLLEEVAESYLKELIDRNLISIRKHRHNGKIGSCGIHDLVRDLCLKVGEQQEFFHVTGDQIQGTERRLICSSQFNIQHNGTSLARSMLSRTFRDPLNHHKLLRVLYKGYLAEHPDENVNFRYLAYKHSYNIRSVSKLPSSVSNMWNLQSLIVILYRSARVVVAPIEIWKMRQLRHVKCSQIYVPDPPPRSNGLLMMDNLQTLTRAVNLRLSEKVCMIIPNIKKLHIDYDTRLKGYDDSLIECLCNLDCLHKLESLKLSIKVGRWPTQDQELHKMVRFPVSLNKLSLRSCIRPQLNKILRFPISLNKLTLNGCCLGWEDLWMIGSLPQLEVLQLRVNSITGGRKWSPIEGQFLRLKFLRIDWCHLQSWEADKSHFPVLEKLLLSQLWYLEEIPSGIGEIATLELIHVNHCSESAAVSAVRIKEDEVENQGSDALQIKLTMFLLNMESFKERVEEEGLTINHIQLEAS